MRTASAALQAHIAQETTTLATCWKVTRRDDTVIGFTDHDADIDYNGTTYEAAIGYEPSAVVQSGKLDVDNIDVRALIDSDSITVEDLRGGAYDHASIEIFVVNWDDLSMGAMTLVAGTLGEVSVTGERYDAELRSLAQAVQQNVGRVIGPECDVRVLGDERCGVDVANYTEHGTVTTVGSSGKSFHDTGMDGEDTDYFRFGRVTWTSGNNIGFTQWVRSDNAHASGRHFVLLDAPPYAIQVGDDYDAIAGCDKRITTCRNKFNNLVNFQGFPGVPGIDASMTYP